MNPADANTGTVKSPGDLVEGSGMKSFLGQDNSLMEALLANSLDLIYFKDRESRFVRYSRSFALHFGLHNHDALEGKTDFDCYAEARARSAFEDEQRIILTGEPMIGKPEQGVRADGRVTWFLTSKMPWREAGGKIVGTFGISREVTELKEIESKYEETSGLLQTLLENSPDPIYFKDRQSRFVYFSKAFEKLFKVTDAGSLRGKTDFDFFREEHARPAYEDEQEIIRTARPIIGKLEKETHADGRITWALTTKLPWRGRDGDIIGTFGISKDVTPMKDSEQRLEEVYKELLETSRMAGMAEVATSVLHNVGNALNSVNVSASVTRDQLARSRVSNLAKATELLHEHSGDLAEFLTADDRGKHLPNYLRDLSKQLVIERDEMLLELERLTGNIDHIKEIVAMQQSYARVSGVIETLEVPGLIEEALRLNTGAFIGHEVRLVREYGENLPRINVDKHKVVQILVNLIRNAYFACEDSDRPDKQLTLRVASGNDRVSIAVVDNGVGIPLENITRIFNHGFTTRKDGHGFGLHSGALAAKELGGSLVVHSDGPGTGASFTLELPLQPPSRN